VTAIINYLINNKQELSEQITDIIGKPISQSRDEVEQAILKSTLMRNQSTRTLRENVRFETKG